MCGLDTHQLVDLTAQHTPGVQWWPESPPSTSHSERAGGEAAAPGCGLEEVRQHRAQCRHPRWAGSSLNPPLLLGETPSLGPGAALWKALPGLTSPGPSLRWVWKNVLSGACSIDIHSGSCVFERAPKVVVRLTVTTLRDPSRPFPSSSLPVSPPQACLDLGVTVLRAFKQLGGGGHTCVCSCGLAEPWSRWSSGPWSHEAGFNLVLRSGVWKQRLF